MIMFMCDAHHPGLPVFIISFIVFFFFFFFFGFYLNDISP